jgi:hypothetical protein
MAVFAALCAPASAAPLNLTTALPDVFSDAIYVQYTSVDDQFLAMGFAEELVDQSSTHHPISGAQGFSINATIDDSGTAIVGSLAITGDVNSISAGSPLLTGDLTAFGFPNSGDEPLEFLFEVTGGSLATAAYFGAPGPGSIVGVILSQTGSNFIDWSHDFDNSANIVGAVSDTFKPEPATLALLVLGAVSLSAKRRRGL